MIFTQQSLLFDKTVFEFGEKKLTFTIDGETQRICFTVPYTAISSQKSLKSFSMLAVSRLGRAISIAALLSYVMVFIVNYSLHKTDMEGLIFFAVVGLGVGLRVLGKKYAKYDATLIPAGAGNSILILHDDQHQTILEEIIRRKRSELRRIYSQVDRLNHPDLELKKFLWLKEEGVISENEFSEARLKISTESAITAAPHY